MKEKVLHWSKRVGVLLAATLLACLLAELVVLLVLGEQVKFPRHVVGADFGLRVNEPNAEYRHKSPDVEVWFRINSRGLRADVDYPYEKPAGTLRIISLGDSFAAGYEVELEDCFSSVLERELRAKGYPVEVINAGVSGYSTAEECLYLERELLRYDPDVVLVSFYSNDIKDNIRTHLFRLSDGELVQEEDEYVPMGAVANFLNTNFLFSFLSEYSNAFALLKEQTTLRLKKRMVARNVSEVAKREGFDDEDDGPRTPKGETPYHLKLTCALYDRLYATLSERGIPLVVQSIPHETVNRDGEPGLKDRFPVRCFDVEREGLALVHAKKLLAPFLGKELLYWQRSHKHWTPFAHRVAGVALAQRIDEAGFLSE